MPKSTGMGVVLGAVGFIFGFAMVWHIWWLVALCLLATFVALIIRSSNDDIHFVVPASEIEAAERDRLYSTRRIPTDSDPLIDVAGAQTLTEQS